MSTYEHLYQTSCGFHVVYINHDGMSSYRRWVEFLLDGTAVLAVRRYIRKIEKGDKEEFDNIYIIIYYIYYNIYNR